MAGVKLLRKMQLGLEAATAQGTAVAATTIWRGMGTLEDMTEVVFPEEEVGYIGGTDRSYVPRVGATINMDDIEATFEQLPYILNAAICTAAASADGAGTGKIYEYPFATTALPTIDTYTIEGGDNQQAEEAEYCFVKSFSLSGSPGEAIMMSAEWEGRQVTPTTYTGALSLPTVEEILFSKGTLYIDAATAAIGTTAVSDTLLGMTLNFNTGIIAKRMPNNQLYFATHQFTMPEVTLDLTFEHNTSAVAEKAAWKAETPRQIKLVFAGSALTTAATYTYKTLAIELVGKWTKFNPLGDLDGNDIIEGTLTGRFNSDAALFGRITVVNELAALP